MSGDPSDVEGPKKPHLDETVELSETPPAIPFPDMERDQLGTYRVFEELGRDGQLKAKVWLMHVGRVRLYLLDCDVEGNRPQDRELTSRLYGGDLRTRVRQELVLGVGGVKALRALGITPGVYHLNEGHSAFAPLEVICQRMHDDGMTFDDMRPSMCHNTFPSRS